MRWPWKRILFSMMSAAVLLPVADAGEPVAWETIPPRALREARAEAKPVWIDFWAVWCKPCRVMDQTTYRDSRVERALRDFVALKVDGDANHVFVDRHAVEHYPTTLVLDGQGREILRTEGLLDAERALELMERVRDGYADYLANAERPEDPGATEAVAAYLERTGNPSRAAELLRRCLKLLGDEQSPEAQALQLRMAEARLAAGAAAPAARLLSRLAEETADRELRGRALAALVRAERERGREERAAEALNRLFEEYPDLARELRVAGGPSD